MFRNFSGPIQAGIEIVPQIGHDHFLSNPIEIIIPSDDVFCNHWEKSER